MPKSLNLNITGKKSKKFKKWRLFKVLPYILEIDGIREKKHLYPSRTLWTRA